MRHGAQWATRLMLALGVVWVGCRASEGGGPAVMSPAPSAASSGGAVAPSAAPAPPGLEGARGESSSRDAGSAQADAAGQAGPSAVFAPPDPLALDAAKATNAFAFGLYAKAPGTADNFVVSPLSVSLALAMVSAGALGETRTQMLDVLHLGGLADPHTAYGRLVDTLVARRDPRSPSEFRLANRLWGLASAAFVPDCLALLERKYGAPIGRVDMSSAPEEARAEINRWVAEKTSGRIEELVPRGVIAADTRLLVTNALYFKGVWKARFDKTATQAMPFAAPKKKVTANLMQMTADIAHAHVDHAQAVELPYEGGLSMVLVLPDEKTALREVEADFSRYYERLVSALEKKLVHLAVPRFRATTALDLRPALSALGMPLVFTPHADLRGLLAHEPGRLSKVLHQSTLEVNEEGAEAAAATSAVVVTYSAPEPTPFHADRPFAYVLRDRATGAIVFVGRVSDPTL